MLETVLISFCFFFLVFSNVATHVSQFVQALEKHKLLPQTAHHHYKILEIKSRTCELMLIERNIMLDTQPLDKMNITIIEQHINFEVSIRVKESNTHSITSNVFFFNYYYHYYY